MLHSKYKCIQTRISYGQLFGGLCAANAPERNWQGSVDWLKAPCHYEVWSKTQERPHFSGWKWGRWWMLAYACSAHAVENPEWFAFYTHTLEIWHTSNGKKKSSNLWLDLFLQTDLNMRTVIEFSVKNLFELVYKNDR